MADKVLYIVHCVDTEGPLYESTEATFERIYNSFGLEFEPTKEKLNEVQQGIGVPSHLKNAVMDFVSTDRLNYNSNWEQVDLHVGPYTTERMEGNS